MTTLCAAAVSCCQVTVSRILAGPNAWSPRPVLELALEVVDLSQVDWRRLESLLASVGVKPVPEAAASSPEAFANWFGATLVRLQTAVGGRAQFHAWRPTTDCATLQLVVEYDELKVARAIIAALLRWLDACSHGEHLAIADEWARLDDLAYDTRLGNTTGSIVEAAVARGIPYQRLDDESLVQLGQGRLQRRVRMATTDRTGSIATSIATDKQLAKRLLKEIGVPVAAGREVFDLNDARRAAEELGWPVVVKPADADFGNGVSIRLTSTEQLDAAYETARRWSSRVLVERFVPGTLYRLLVVGGKLIAAVRREPAYVVGDGRHTILELLEIATRDPARGEHCPSPWKKFAAAGSLAPVVAARGEPNDTIPAAGITIPLEGDIYMRQGGVQQDRTTEVHPEIVELAIDTAATVGLDIAGLDLIAEDITRPLDGQSLAILEVNPEPAIILHMAKFSTPARPVAQAIVESLFPDDQVGRIPTIAVLGELTDLNRVWREVAEWRQHHSVVGLATREGVWLNGRRLGPSQASVVQHTRRLMRHPRTDAIVIHLTLADILAEGLPFDRCDELIELNQVAPIDKEARRALECVRATVRGTTQRAALGAFRATTAANVLG